MALVIDYMKLKNYRQYRDVYLEFSPSADKSISVIQGGMGTGKTNLLNALTWCLYSKEYHVSQKYEGLPILNTMAFRELNATGVVPVEVEIQLSDKNKKYRISRRIHFEKTPASSPQKVPYRKRQADGTCFEVYAQIGRDSGFAPYPEDTVQSLFPERIHGYFLFDGERLGSYFERSAVMEIKEAVFKISQLELLDAVRDHLNTLKNEWFKQCGNIVPQAQVISEQISSRQNRISELENQKNKHLHAKNEANTIVGKLTKELIQDSEQDIRKLAEERERLQNELTKLEQQRTQVTKDITDYVLRMGPAITLKDAINQTWHVIKKHKDSGEIPPLYKRTFLEKLLGKGICICGSDISKAGESRNSIEKLLNQCDEITNISEEVTVLSATLRRMQEEINGYPKRFLHLEKQGKEFQDLIDIKNERITFITDKIGGSDIVEIRRLEAKIEDYRSKISDADIGIGSIQVQIQNLEDEIAELKNERKREIEKTEKLDKLRKKLTFCEDALEVVTRVKERIMRTTKKDIARFTKDGFLNIHWKEKTYTDVKIDEDYVISVREQSGSEGLGTLSQGENQCLALSFMASVNRISGFSMPVVIDTPFGRIAKEPKENIASFLQKFFIGKHITLLVTDEEYTPSVRQILKPYVCNEYRIDFIETKEGSEVEVVHYEK